MTLTEQIYAQAVLLSGTEDAAQKQLLELFCRSAKVHWHTRLREGLTPEDCKADFVAAGALYALASLSEVDPVSCMERIEIGAVNLVPGNSSAASRCLRKQADLMMAPYCMDAFSFWGV